MERLLNVITSPYSIVFPELYDIKYDNFSTYPNHQEKPKKTVTGTGIWGTMWATLARQFAPRSARKKEEVEKSINEKMDKIDDMFRPTLEMLQIQKQRSKQAVPHDQKASLPSSTDNGDNNKKAEGKKKTGASPRR